MENENNKVTKQEQETKVEDTIEVHSVEDDAGLIGADNADDVKETSDKEEEEQKSERKPRAKKRIQTLANENRELREELEALKGHSTDDNQGKDTKDSTLKKPNMDDYDSFDEYDRALEKYEVESYSAKKEKEDEADEKRQAEVYGSLDILFDDARDKFKDFDTVITNDKLHITVDLMENLLEFDDGAGDILYYLANNSKLLDELVELSPKKQLKQLARLEDSLLSGKTKQSKQARTSNAPEPITPIEGGSTNIKSLEDDDLSFEEYEALANQKKTGSKGGWL